MKAISTTSFALLFLLTVQSPAQSPPTEIGDVAKIVGRGRYMVTPACKAKQTPASAQCCAPLPANDALFASILSPYTDYRSAVPKVHHGLQDCRYENNDLETRVIMLNPDANRVAEWTVSACRAASAKSVLECARWVWGNIYKRSGTQFAVAGAVIEPFNGKCWNGKEKPGDHVGFTFRDGVTVRLVGTQGVCEVNAKRLAAEPSPFRTAAVTNTTSGGPSRVTMMTRQEYAEFFTPNLPPPADTPDAAGSIEWLVRVREAHMGALGKTSHPWLNKLVVARLPAKYRMKQ